jgi:phospholipid-translocating ATPase
MIIVIFAIFLGYYISNSIITHYNVFYLVGTMLLILIACYFSLTENIQLFNNLQINEEKKIK